MGTNFYWKKLPPELEELVNDKNKDIIMHIGKRSGAGDYCYDCGTTFCEYGDRGVHKTLGNWYDKCPICGKEGKWCCSFTWTFMKQKEVIKKYVGSSRYLIRNEYDEEFTPREFLEEELSNSTMEFQVAWRFC